ncbi:MAG: hypothetical protein ACOCYB_08835 [Alkalispirochaeta sp.]
MRYGSVANGMELLTVDQIIKEQPEEVPSTALTIPRALGASRYDAVLVSPVAAAHHVTDQLAVLFRRAEYSVSVVHCPAAHEPHPSCDLLDHARVCLIVVPERVRVDSQWLWWVLGRATATTRRQAVIPVARRDSAKPLTQFRPALPPPLQALSYIGRSRAVGEAHDSLWVAPPGAAPSTREAINLEYWVYDR